jgi:hypothetical protein
MPPPYIEHPSGCYYSVYIKYELVVVTYGLKSIKGIINYENGNYSIYS